MIKYKQIERIKMMKILKPNNNIFKHKVLIPQGATVF